MSDLQTTAERVAAAATHPAWPRQLQAALRLEIASPNPESETAQRVATHLAETNAETVRELIFELQATGAYQDEQWNWELVSAICGAAEVRLRSDKSPPEAVASVPKGENLDLSLSLDSLTVALLDLIREAENEIVFLSPFFTTEALDLLSAPLKSAAERGVKIQIITRSLTYDRRPASNREFLRELLSNELLVKQTRLHEYVDAELDSTIHAKLVLVDRERLYLGTANLTHRGLIENLELGVISEDQLVNELKLFVDELLDADFTHEVTYHAEEGSFTR